MRLLRPLVLAALALSLASCAHAPRAPTHEATFVIVRHAEKTNDDLRDPSLSAIGQARAERLAVSLRDVSLQAVYATSYRRTQQTAAPTAQSHGLTTITYDAKQPVEAFATQLKQTHPTGTVLVVGHSNTVPGLAAALCQCEVASIGEKEFDHRFTVRIDANGVATLTHTRDP